VPPMLLGIPGDNKHDNYAEANRAFWRETVLPLVGRSMKALSVWLGPSYGGGLELRPDLDAIEALSAERDALWARIDKATFLTDAEKRAAVGYGDEAEDAGEAKFSPAQPRVPGGQPEGGRWSGPDTGFGNLLVPVQAPGRTGLPIDLTEEEAQGGHTIERHVAKPIEYLKARVLGNRINIPLLGALGEKRAGSFTSLEAANKLVNMTVAANKDVVDAFVAGGVLHALPMQYIFLTTSRPTGYEAYAPNERSQPVIRDTFGVFVELWRSNKSSKGYYVLRAMPINED